MALPPERSEGKLMQNTQSPRTGRSAALLITAALCACFGLAGCSNTMSGAKQDATTDTQKVATATDDAAAKTAAAAHAVGHEAKDVPKDVNSAAIITPEVKTAILRDPVLNNPANLINVNSHDNVTHLKGHVMTADMKTRAQEDAQVVLSKRHPDYKVSNELAVSGH